MNEGEGVGEVVIEEGVTGNPRRILEIGRAHV